MVPKNGILCVFDPSLWNSLWKQRDGNNQNTHAYLSYLYIIHLYHSLLEWLCSKFEGNCKEKFRHAKDCIILTRILEYIDISIHPFWYIALTM